jgi:tetratricopeptide (TPR) repeat protein
VSRRPRKQQQATPTPEPHSDHPKRTVAVAHPVRIAIVGAVVLVVVVAGLFAFTRWRHSNAVSRLPAPPRLTARQHAIERHLRERYEAAVREPSSIAAVGPLCMAYHADMFFDLAEQCYDIAARLAPGDQRWIYYRAIIQSERGGGETLVGNLRRVVERDPKHGAAWLRLGEAEFKAGRYDEAAAAWQKARELPDAVDDSASPRHHIEVPLSAYASLGLARVALVRGDVDRARTILEELSAAEPQFGSALRLLADSYRRTGKESEAARLVYRAGRLPPFVPYADPAIDHLARESRNSIFLLRLASEANLSINAEWSEHLTRRALEFDPDNPEVVLKLARILRTVERNDEALELFLRYEKMVPGDYQALGHIGSSLSAMGRLGEAESYFRRALAGLDDPLTHYNMGLLLALTGRVDEAIVEYQKALERDPLYSDARSNLAAAFARRGQLDRAAAELRRLLEHDPENASARTNLGLVLLQQGRRDEARVQLEEALRLDPAMIPAAQALEEASRQ